MRPELLVDALSEARSGLQLALDHVSDGEHSKTHVVEELRMRINRTDAALRQVAREVRGRPA